VRAPGGALDAGARQLNKGYHHLAPPFEAQGEVVDRRRQHDPGRRVCRVLPDARSHDDHQPRSRDEAPLQAAMARRAAVWPPSGYRRITALLHRAQVQVNRQPVARLRRERGRPRQRPARRPRTTARAHPYPRYPNLVHNLELAHPDQVGVGDMTSVRVHKACVDLAVLMEVDPRAMRGWHLSRHLDRSLTLTALRRALGPHRPAIHHADPGVQSAATAYVRLLQASGGQSRMTTGGEATEHGYAERLRRTITEEEVTLHEYLDFHDAYQHLGRFLDEVYPRKRLQSALGYLTPAVFEPQWLQQPITVPLT
jgi:putative transposase